MTHEGIADIPFRSLIYCKDALDTSRLTAVGELLQSLRRMLLRSESMKLSVTR